MNKIYTIYRDFVIDHPWIIISAFAVILLAAASQLGGFRLDASSESLILENDQALLNFRETNKQFSSSEEYVVVTYTPKTELFSDQGIAKLRTLRDQLAVIDGVAKTNSILNVPLLYSPDLTIANVAEEMKTMDENDVDPRTAQESLLSNPLYPDLLISTDGKTTAIQLILEYPQELTEVKQQRSSLKAELAKEGRLDTDKQALLDQLNDRFVVLSEQDSAKRNNLIDRVREVMSLHKDEAEMHLGGIPMIVVDMIRFIKSDLSVFGVGVLLFLLLTLTVIFRQWRLVVIPLLCCGFTVLLVSGYLGMSQWPITVISSNFISLLLIMTLSLTIHVIVRYREYQRNEPEADSVSHLRSAMDAMIKPCAFMVLTTVVAFCSFTLSDILPVIDFGWMMTIGLFCAFAITFILFPAILRLVPPKPDNKYRTDSKPVTLILSKLTQKFPILVLCFSAVVAVLSAVGLSRLTVENSFIDYFKTDTEIYQGMLAIDEHLGGTTPLDVVITDKVPPKANNSDEECDPFLDECDESEIYRDTWFTFPKIERIEAVHNYLLGLKETGKVVSLATTVNLINQVNGNKPLTDFELALVPKVIPEKLASTLLTPYVSEENRRVRFNIRLIDSEPELRRQILLEEINQHLTEELNFEQDQVLLTGMTVLYNNMLQSLFDSQIKTLGVVFIAIMVMFLVLFRSLWLSVIGLVPNMLAAAALLGLMGLLSIPLDIMTITVAAISVGIAVDNTIHYIHRFKEEISIDGDYIAAMHRCHSTIGRAMFYTSLTIIIGFSILVLSNFIPTIYFGLFTCFAMLVALIGALTLLPAMIILFKPFGKYPTVTV